MKQWMTLLISLIGFGVTLAQSPKATLPGFVEVSAAGQDFAIGQYPVTNAQYQAFLKANPSQTAPKYWTKEVYPKGKENHPVVFISYEAATNYCSWLESQYPDWDFRLPTMTEWELAAGGADGRAYPWGNTPSLEAFNYNANVASHFLKQNPTVTYTHPRSTKRGQSAKLNDAISMKPNGLIVNWINHKEYTGFVYTDLFEKLMAEGGYTTPVDRYPKGKSPYGVWDLSGNIWEWTSTLITATNGAERGQTVNAVKGGSWYANASSCKISMRGEGRKPKMGYNTVGFRVVATRKATPASPSKTAPGTPPKESSAPSQNSM